MDRLKEFLNRMDYNLKTVFECVEINRLENQKKLIFEVKLSKFKSNPNNKAELVFYINESTIYDNSMIWEYKINPLDENSPCVTRTSTLDSLIIDTRDIINEDRFSREYLNTLLDQIDESQHIDGEEIIDIDDSFEFNIKEVVLIDIDDKEGIIIDREKLVVENIRYNVYQVCIDDVQKSIFEYDINKK